MLRLVIETKLLLAPHYFCGADLAGKVVDIGRGTMGPVAISRYLKRLVLQKVLIEATRHDGLTVYLCGPEAAEWFRQEPTTRPGGNSGRWKSYQLAEWKARDAKEQENNREAWKQRVAQLRMGIEKPDASEPMEM